MKFAGAAITVLAFASSQAAAVQDHSQIAKLSSVAHCGVVGEKCHEGRSAAAAVARALTEHKDAPPASGISAFCSVEGTKGCNQKWAAVDKIGAAAAKAHGEISRREAAAEADARRGGNINFCGVPGEACSDKRDANPGSGGRINFCGVPGEACSDKRDAFPRRGGQINFCGVPGEACSDKRDAAPGRGGRINFCGVPGEACSDKRGVEEAQAAIRKYDPSIEKEECHQDGQPCNLILKAHQAFNEVKARSAEARRGGQINFCGVPGEACSDKRDAQLLAHEQEGGSELTHAHLVAFGANTEKIKAAEKECNGPNGACTHARRAVDELEAAIKEGVQSVYTL
ncbi:hypothetical protein LTR78_002432 [Recurvomyces mirabilis]|uniref:Uncharacterized protein n=1 Tax=Recurvomyces mirabilis TaxID=574656 RepID=A0AAE0WTG0_9PEZI|nr:hypothetical protein LTR78_002432 [Recurvomyces mirabilis]KAK5157361.1 hypothetical protein LTS14_004126 [Recurvomyces mirabilis]